MESRTPKLSQKDYMKTALRSYLLQNAFNYTSYQGVSYLYTIMPALKKIYKDEPEKLKEAAGSANLEFYNTNPQMLPFITSMQLAMYDNGQSVTDTRSIKMALMGPLSGIGDSIAQFGICSFILNNLCRVSNGWFGFCTDGLLVFNANLDVDYQVINGLFRL